MLRDVKKFHLIISHDMIWLKDFSGHDQMAQHVLNEIPDISPKLLRLCRHERPALFHFVASFLEDCAEFLFVYQVHKQNNSNSIITSQKYKIGCCQAHDGQSADLEDFVMECLGVFASLAIIEPGYAVTMENLRIISLIMIVFTPFQFRTDVRARFERKANKTQNIQRNKTIGEPMLRREMSSINSCLSCSIHCFSVQ